MIEVASFLLSSEENSNCWTMSSKEEVTFPTGDTITAYSEVTPGGNYLHIRSDSGRLCSIKCEGAFNVMFLLPSGEEAYVELRI
ncbi:MAG: hypothetical protein ABJ308_13870 [Halieaceae bacterium]